MKNDLLFHKLMALPENLKIEVEDFIDFLISKIHDGPVEWKTAFWMHGRIT